MHIPLQRGMLLRHQGHLYSVVSFEERRAGKQKPTVHVVLRDMRDAHPVDRTLDQLEPLEEVPHAYRQLQYLYARGDDRIFMDSESFEEITLGTLHLHGIAPFLKEGETYSVLFAGDQPLSLNLPDSVVLGVRETAPPAHGAGNTSSVLKEATLENELVVRVPLFIKSGDAIRVDTHGRTYLGKE